MLTADAPCVSKHAMWYLAQLSARSRRRDGGARVALLQGFSMSAFLLFPLFPHEVTDDAEPVRIAAAASDQSSPNMPLPWPKVEHR